MEGHEWARTVENSLFQKKTVLSKEEYTTFIYSINGTSKPPITTTLNPHIIETKEEDKTVSSKPQKESVVVSAKEDNTNINHQFRICPTCSSKSLKTENGCDSCIECGYSKCDK